MSEGARDARLAELLDQMRRRAGDALAFVDGYFEINLDVVWRTVRDELPVLVNRWTQSERR